jgi:hypothetical protein
MTHTVVLVEISGWVYSQWLYDGRRWGGKVTTEGFTDGNLHARRSIDQLLNHARRNLRKAGAEVGDSIHVVSVLPWEWIDQHILDKSPLTVTPTAQERQMAHKTEPTTGE